MGEHGVAVVVTFTVVLSCYALAAIATFRHVSARTPAGIVHRLFQTRAPVTVVVNVANRSTWDPSLPLGRLGFFAPGTVTYTLENPRTVRAVVRFRSGDVVERSGIIPDLLLPDSPEKTRRRRIARVVVALYLLLGTGAFLLTYRLAGGSVALRARIAAVTGLGALAFAWLVTHYVLTSVKGIRRRSSRDTGVDLTEPWNSWLRHLTICVAGYLLVTAAFAVAWHLGNSEPPHPMSWPSAFLSAGVFVLLVLAVLTASLHHHTYIHHGHSHD